MTTFHIITIFPRIFDSYFNESIIKRALKRNLIKIKVHNLRDWTTDKHKTVDDATFGGGAGMVMKIEPLYKALSSPLIRGARGVVSKTILLSAKGKTWNQQLAKKYSKLKKCSSISKQFWIFLNGFICNFDSLTDKKLNLKDLLYLATIWGRHEDSENEI